MSTSYTNSTTLTAQLSGADMQVVGSDSISVVNTAPGGGTSNSISFAVTAAPTQGTTVIPIQANDLAWDPVNKKIYLSLPSVDGSTGNSVQVLDPATGSLGASTFAGSEPNLLAVSANSKYLYVSLNGASNVQRMTLPNLGLDILIPLGGDKFDGPFSAMDMQAAPNSDATVAVVRDTPGFSPAEEGGVVIYDDGTARTSALCGWIQAGCFNASPGLFDSIQWSSDGSTMFAANNEDTGFDFYTIPVTSAGFGKVTDYGGLAGGFGQDIHYDAVTTYVYDDNGRIINPGSGTVVGTFNASGLMVPDGSLGMAFFLGQSIDNFGSSTYTLQSFDIRHFTPIATLTINNVVGTPTHLIRWGTDGLAFTTSNEFGPPGTTGGAVYIVSGSFVQGTGSNVVPAEISNVQRSWKHPQVVQRTQSVEEKTRSVLVF
ncbi:YncE family protein [Tunturiibacter gelidoferens]|uniref:TIGR03118 family protein n=1 Tax=Tunturiibacter lichenicola TaxID=2051959 RepID=A0A7Y9NNP0_9BACT|nr:hypothetical protein [Edaphobacter lichenicola]NYF52698.1 hypothetical protein [Edaphobacter lichenicola]